MPRGRKPKRALTQEQWIMEQMAQGRQVDQWGALHEYGIGRLASRINDLENKGYKGCIEHVWVPTKDGNGHQGYRFKQGVPIPSFKKGEGPQGQWQHAGTTERLDTDEEKG